MPSIVIAQGGGPTAVINETLRGIIDATQKLQPGVKILGARHGVRGLVSRDVVDLTALGEDDLARLGRTPSAALGSTRDKPDPKACEAIFAALEAFEARAFVYIGGNDTAGTLDLLHKRHPGGCHFVHAPKTIDNDLMANDHVPGFISAGTFVANAMVSADLDFRALPGIYVAVIMGRHAGFLTAAASAWQAEADDPPHLFYAPERPFNVNQFLDDVAACYERLGHCTVAMSEGVQDEAGKPLAEALAAGGIAERDAHGNVQLTGGDLGIEIQRVLKARFPKGRSRVDTLGYMPRCFLGTTDPTDRQEALAAGVFAAERALSESGSVALAFDGERSLPTFVPLDHVAGRTRLMPDAFFEGRNAISDEGRRYFRRLLPPRPDLFKRFI